MPKNASPHSAALDPVKYFIFAALVGKVLHQIYFSQFIKKVKETIFKENKIIMQSVLLKYNTKYCNNF